jgi:restriction system protein
LTKHTRDGGYDIIAMRHLNKHNSLKFLVECKRNAEQRKVGIGGVRAFKEVVQAENANRELLVTTPYFTKDAEQKMNQVPYLIDYKDKNDLINWVANYYKTSLNL